MWMLRNRTAYAAQRTWARDKHGVHHWMIAVKATFTLGSSGALELADAQLPPLPVPEWFGDPSATSLKLDSDMGASKPTTDLIVIGSAYAPKGREATSVLVRLRAGSID